jgi:hypothetical protein
MVFAPGADDNASGVAAALEIARVFKQYNYVPESTIKFVTFAAEELGLHGANYYASTSSNAGTDLKLMINNDMISYCTKTPDNWEIVIQKYPNSQWATDMANEIITNHTLLTAVEKNDAIQYSDSYAFFNFGYPAIFFIEEEFTPFYHTNYDLVSTVNKDYAAEVTKISMGMLIALNGTGSPTQIHEEDASVLHVGNYPNPFNNHTSIRFELKTPDNVEISIFEPKGNLIQILTNEYMQSGFHTLTWNSEELASGVYFCKIKTSQNEKILRIVKIK